MSKTDAEKVPTTQYVDAGSTEAAKEDAPTDALIALAKAGDVNAQAALGRKNGLPEKLKADGWEVGKPAPKTLYLDSDGKTVQETPSFTDGLGTVLVNEGETVTQQHVNLLA